MLLVHGLASEADVIEPSFVESPLFKDEGVDFFSSKLTLGVASVKTIHPLEKFSADKDKLVSKVNETLIANIKKGVDFPKENS